MLDDLAAHAPPTPWRRRLLVGLGAALATALIAWLALLLGAVGFDLRRFSQHEGRLARLVAREPTLELVERAFADEGTRRLAAPSTPGEIEAAVLAHGGARAAGVRAKARRWRTTRVFLAGDMVYFAYFDEDGVLRDFTCVSR